MTDNNLFPTTSNEDEESGVYYNLGRTRKERLDNLRDQLGNDTDVDLQNSQYEHLSAVVIACGHSLEYGLMLLQYHGYRNFDGVWLEDLILYGYVVPTSYVGVEAGRGLKSRCNKELVSPHGQYFLLAFFSDATLD